MLVVPQGCQHWLVARTDRDGASAEDVAGMIGGWLQFISRQVLGEASDLEVLATGEREWRTESLRPVRLLAGPSRSPLALPAGTLLGRSQDLAVDPIPNVTAEAPWWMVLEVWSRKPHRAVPWPGLAVSWPGRRRLELDRADWLLLESRQVAGSDDPGDASWADAMTENISETAKAVAREGESVLWSVALATLAIGGGLALARRRRRR